LTTSSHPFGFHPPAPAPVPLHKVPALQATGNPDVPALDVVESPEPAFPMCATCGNRRHPLAPRGNERYRSGAQVLYCADGCDVGPVRAAAGVIAAAMQHGLVTPVAIAQAEHDRGLLFDPKRVQDVADAACEQVRAELEAELAQAREAIQARDWFHARWQSVQRLVAGRPGTDLMLVSEILAATDPNRAAGQPLSVTWDGLVLGPSGDTEGENTLVPCTTEHGAQAVLVLDTEQRAHLGGLLVTPTHTGEACATPGCGLAAEDLDASGPSLWGWICVEVVGTEQGPRWWCNPLCVSAAIADARAELAAADQLAAITPAAPAPGAVVEDDVAHCHRCGCTDDRACEGGCYWVPNPQMVDLCSACASPEQLAYAARRMGGQGETS
jgi:hypothetical protein